ncbi:MAG TPA: flagellar biosynthesis protein FlhB [Alphaproteobacteria bacterium]|jgi:flagellar biosynthetic protein FlhB
MSEDNDDSQKTEEPSQKKLDEARKNGQVAVSRELNHWFMILGGTLFVTMFAPSTLLGIYKTSFRFIASPEDMPIEGGHMGELFSSLYTSVGLALFAPLGLLVVLALASGLVQTGVLFSAESIMPKLEKVSPMAGVKRLFSMKSIIEFLKGIVKIVVVGAVALMVVWPEFSLIDQLPTYSVPDLLHFIGHVATKLMIATLSIVTLIAGADVFYQRMAHIKSLRMSKQEVRDEMKQSDGDPMIKSRLRQLRMERARKRMMAAVPKATVIVTNPTHYAIALKYEHGSMEAPLLIAKGVDEVAMRIRAVATSHDIPIVENPPLARALYATVEIDRPIPAEHYKAVAEIIGYVMKLKRRMGGR